MVQVLERFGNTLKENELIALKFYNDYKKGEFKLCFIIEITLV